MLRTSFVAVVLAGCGTPAGKVVPPVMSAVAVTNTATGNASEVIRVGGQRPCEYVETTDGGSSVRTLLRYEHAPARCEIRSFMPEDALACFTVREWPNSAAQRITRSFNGKGRLVQRVDESGSVSTST